MQKENVIIKLNLKVYKFLSASFIILGIFFIYAYFRSIEAGTEFFVSMVILSIGIIAFIISPIVYIRNKRMVYTIKNVLDIYEKIGTTDNYIKLPQDLLVTRSILQIKSIRRDNVLRYKFEFIPVGNPEYRKKLELWGPKN